MAIFSLAAVFMSTAAWFTVMRQVKTDGDGFLASKISPVVKRVDIYEKATASVQKGSEKNPYIYNSTPSLSYFYGSDQVRPEGSQDPIGIGKYSILEETKSLLFLFTLDETKTEELKTSQLTVKTSTGNENSLYAMNSTTGKVKRPLSTNGIQNALSSIVSFSSFTDKSVMTERDQTYIIDKDSIKTHKNQAFVDSSSYTYRPSIPLTDPDLSSVSQIGVIVEYSTNLIEHLYSINLGNPVMDQSDIDFKLIDFSFHI